MKYQVNRITLHIKCIALIIAVLNSNTCLSQRSNPDTLFLDPAKFDSMATWERSRSIPAKGMLKDFADIFQGVHGQTYVTKFQRSPDVIQIRYDSIEDVYYQKSNKPRGLMPGTKLMAWHPSWMTEEYTRYPYHLLSTIAFFAYDINPASGLNNDTDAIEQWKVTPMIDSAKKHNVRVLLTLTSYGQESNRKFLGHNESWPWLRLRDSVRLLLQHRQADGIDIDFDSLDSSVKDKFTLFVSFLRKSFGNTATITLQVPFDSRKDGYDFKKLATLVDVFVIKGFDPNGNQCDNKPIPSAPLLGSKCPGVEQAVNELIRSGIAIDDIIVSMPLFGTHWERNGKSWSFVKYVPYDDIRTLYTIDRTPSIDQRSGSANVQVGSAKKEEVIWYESTASLSGKFQWMKDKGLNGAGLWGMGYDGADPELWSSVATAFAAPEWQVIPVLGYENGPAYSVLLSAKKYKKYIGASLFIIVCFFVAGILFSCLDWRVRDAFFHNHSYRAILAGGILAVLATVVYLFYGDDGPSFSGFCYGLLAGGAVVYIITSIHLNYRKKLK